MSSANSYIEKNRQSWNSKVEHHVGSAFYDVEGFLKGKSSLNSIELDLLGDVSGKRILHLQCHFGQDTISLARMGAIVTGVDLSDKAIAKANELTQLTNTNARFICCDLYDLPAHLDETFDIVFTSYGTIGWLPDIDRWAALISRYLAPGGTFVFAEFHPVVWMLNYDFNAVGYDYFNTGEIVETDTGTYADRSAPITNETVSWNHGLGEVLTALIKHDLSITSFSEFDYSPYDCFKGAEAFEPGKYRIAHLQYKIPMVYALSARRDI